MFSIPLLLLLLCGLVAGLGAMLFLIPRRLGHRKLGAGLLSAYVLIIVVLTLGAFRMLFVTQPLARNLFRADGIELADGFSITDRHSTFAIGDSYDAFTAHLSDADYQRVRKTITESSHFLPQLQEDIYQGYDMHLNKKQVVDFETDNYFVREVFIPAEKEGYAPTYHRISLSKKKKTLCYEDIDE
ncbi:MAG: hypothetical protein MJZ49_06605 [Bacteroidales bacterium]|nr:hypothetical protein [Bacteroidales bacterium]